MRDLELWRKIERGDASATEIAALASWTLAQRAAHLGLVAPLATHADPEIRIAAFGALAGARGVPGVRTLVAGLDDPDERVWRAALDALRATARDAPGRYVHALFHERVEIRRAALADVPRAATEAAAYLRADPACADLAAALPWPDHPLPLAFDLHHHGAATSQTLIDVMLATPPSELMRYLREERGRDGEAVEAHLAAAAKAPELPRASGVDVIDQLVRAIDEVERPDRPLDALVEALRSEPRLFVRRVAVAFLARLAVSPSRVVVMAAVALAPLALGFPGFPAGKLAHVAEGLVRFRWPVKPGVREIDQLMSRPEIRADLAVAVAICGLYTGKRLARLAKALGAPTILETLATSGTGWAEMCRLPEENPALELRWLAALESHPERHAELAGTALAIFLGKRLETFVDQLPRRTRSGAYLALALRPSLSPDDGGLLGATRVMAPRLDRTQIGAIFLALLAPAAGERGIQIALGLARTLDDKQLASAAGLIDDAAAARFVIVLDGFDALPRDRELALAKIFLDREHPAVKAWAERVTRVTVSAPSTGLPAIRARRALDAAQKAAIESATTTTLEAALRPALIAPVTGLVDALAARPAAPSTAACAALIGCADPLPEVARQLDRFADGTPRFEAELDNAAIAMWRTGQDLPPLAHARLWRWEAHSEALGRWVQAANGVLAALTAIDDLPGVLANDTLWRGVAEVVLFARYRDRERYLREGTTELAVFVAERIDRPVIGRHAARIAVALVEGGAVSISAVRQRLLERTADTDAPTRELLGRLVRLDGMPEPPKPGAAAPAGDVIRSIQRTQDLDVLAGWCSDPRAAVVQEAVLMMMMLGERGQLRLADLLTRVSDLPAPVPLLASVALWDSAAALAIAKEIAADASLPAEWRFHLCHGLGEADRAIAAVREPTTTNWFRRADWDALVIATSPLACALALCDADHHHAYARSLEVLLAPDQHDPRVPDALRRFLEASALRPIDLRRAVARRLVDVHGDAIGLPILTSELLDAGAPEAELPRFDETSGTRVARAAVDAALIGGHGACSEKWLLVVLDRLERASVVDRAEVPALYVRILEEGGTALARRTAAKLAVGDALTHQRLVAIAETFAWGVKRGVELTGKLMRIHMTSSERDLGHTYLDQARIFVTPLPLLRREEHGRDIVEGLILHELGHHAYHRGTEAEALWKQAHAEGIGHLLNLVADEHLERNLRAVNRSYGDRLKRLDAYAFQHAAQELRITVLLESLRASSAPALIGIELGVAFDEASVRIRRGAILVELERAGHPLARFARALRMGLGNRTGDPLVGEALALCTKELRKLDMRGLYDLTRRLAAMFGGAIAIARVFCGAEGLELGPQERDLDVHGAGLDDEILQREVERILDPRKSERGGSGPRDRLQINVSPDLDFDKIRTITRVDGDREAHQRLAHETHRHSVRLRAHLDELGLRWEPAKARIQGHTLDRSRLRALVTRSDPRILIARTPVRRTDLFLGTVIDCSASMSAGQNIERAKKFGVMIAEAVRPLPGVDARFFGFTDSVIYDAGDAQQCDVTALEAGGGNNDAAALLHVANIAAASRKRARVIVMISDGLPTECSVAALRGLVTTLTKRRGVVCAQIAVRKLEEECFPHHVILDDAEIDVAVAKFGRMIGDLARKVLAG